MTRPLTRRLAPHLAADLPAAVAADPVAHTWRSYSRTLRTVVVAHRVAGDLAALRVPVLIVHGTRDRTAPLPAAAALIASGCPARLVALPGDHHLAVRHPDLVAGQLAPLVTFPGAVSAETAGRTGRPAVTVRAPGGGQRPHPGHPEEHR